MVWKIQPCIVHFAEIWCSGKLRSMDGRLLVTIQHQSNPML